MAPSPLEHPQNQAIFTKHGLGAVVELVNRPFGNLFLILFFFDSPVRLRNKRDQPIFRVLPLLLMAKLLFFLNRPA